MMESLGASLFRLRWLRLQLRPDKSSYDPTRRSVVLNRPFDKRLTTGRSTKDSRQAVRQKTHDRPFDKRLMTDRIHYSMFDVGRSMFDVR